MVTLMIAMLLVAGACHATGLYFARTGPGTSDPRRLGLTLIFTGIGYAIFGFLGSLCCRYLTDPDLLVKTKWCSYGMLVFGVVIAWLGAWLRARTKRSGPDKKG